MLRTLNFFVYVRKNLLTDWWKWLMNPRCAWVWHYYQSKAITEPPGPRTLVLFCLYQAIFPLLRTGPVKIKTSLFLYTAATGQLSHSDRQPAPVTSTISTLSVWGSPPPRKLLLPSVHSVTLGLLFSPPWPVPWGFLFIYLGGAGVFKCKAGTSSPPQGFFISFPFPSNSLPSPPRRPEDFSILQMRKLSHYKVRWLAYYPTASWVQLVENGLLWCFQAWGTGSFLVVKWALSTYNEWLQPTQSFHRLSHKTKGERKVLEI
jgi:hypothetical protein